MQWDECKFDSTTLYANIYSISKKENSSSKKTGVSKNNRSTYQLRKMKDFNIFNMKNYFVAWLLLINPNNEYRNKKDV